ncbi:MAG: Hpt domain-containing protein, partial [Pirellulaceae bacterium]
AMTAHAMAGDREQSLKAGMNDHVNKPIDTDALFTVLLRWIRPGERKAAIGTSPSRPHLAASYEAAQPFAGALPGIDRATGLMRVAGNEALYHKLLLDFHRNYADTVDRVRTALAESQSTDAERLVHTLKGVAGNIGAMDLHRAAEELDSALRLSDSVKAGTLLPDVECELSIVIKGLEPLAQHAKAKRTEAEVTEGGSAIIADRPAIKTVLRELGELVRKSDPEAEMALERLRGALQGLRGKELERIAQALDLFDFRAAAKALAALAEAEGIPLESGD